MSHQIPPASQGRPSGRRRRQIDLFQIDCAGRSTVCETGLGAQLDHRSTTSSVYAEIHSTSDKNSVPSGNDIPNEADVESQKSQALDNGPVAENLKDPPPEWPFDRSPSESSGSPVPDMTDTGSRETSNYSCPDEITAWDPLFFTSEFSLINRFSKHGESKDQRSPLRPSSPKLLSFEETTKMMKGFIPQSFASKTQNWEGATCPHNTSVPRHLDAIGLSEVLTEQSQENCNDSCEIPDFVSVAGGTGEDDAYSAADEESLESDSVWMSDYSESFPTLPDGHPFLHIKSKATEDALRLYQSYSKCTIEKDMPRVSSAVDAGDNTSSGQAPRVSSSVGSSSLSSGSKRASDGASHNQMDDNDDQDGADERGPPRKRVRASKQSAGRQPSLACPYAKKDPIKYRSCYSYTLKRTKDVKQHLSRSHQLPIYCARCKQIFKSEDERNEHLEVDISAMCPVQNIVYDGVTREQKELLTRRVSPRMTLEDQWFSIFDILFPNHRPRPRSAYVNTELTIDLESFQDMMVAEGPGIITATLASHNIAVTSISNLEHDLSSFFDIVLMEGLQEIANRWTASLVEKLTTGDTENGDDSIVSGTSRPQVSTKQSISSSATLVTERPNGKKSPLLLNHSLEETQAIASLPIRTDVPDRATNDEILPMMSTESQQSQLRNQIERMPSEFQTNPSTENQTPFSHLENISYLFEPQDLMLLHELSEDHGSPALWDNFQFDLETDGRSTS